LAFADSNWPEFRGPTGDGHSVDSDPPIKIDDSVIKWRTAIHGKGWSSPVVWGNQIWLTTATEDGHKMSVICVDQQTGKIIRDKVLVENKDPAFCHPMNSYATPTPVLEEGRVYVHFGSYLTACLDSETAEVIWERRDLECDHHRGPASSPILFDGKLYVAYDGFDVQYVVALNKADGKTAWKRDREIDYGTDNGDRMKAYCTAEVIDVAGKKQLVYPSASATIAYDPHDGKTLWTVYHDGMNASARPILSHGLVFLTNGSGSMVAVRPDGSGDVTGTHIAWSERRAVAERRRRARWSGRNAQAPNTQRRRSTQADACTFSVSEATSSPWSLDANSNSWLKRNSGTGSWPPLPWLMTRSFCAVSQSYSVSQETDPPNRARSWILLGKDLDAHATLDSTKDL
jgi:outer membrane protein assembly factor BamB